MILEATNAIRNGEIVLKTIGYPIKAGVRVTISDEQVYANDIQLALRKGFLVVVDQQNHQNSSSAKKIRIQNVSGRPMGLDQISLLSDEISFISEREYNSTNVQTAINSGMIEVLDREEDEQPVKVSRGKKTAKKAAVKAKPAPVIKQVKKTAKAKVPVKIAPKVKTRTREIIEEEDEYDADAAEALLAEIREAKNQHKTSMTAWEPHSKRMMSKDESSVKVAKVVSSRVNKPRHINEDGIMSGDIDFTEEGVEEAVPVRSSKPTLRGRPTSANRQTAKATQKKNGLTPVGRVRAETKGDLSDEFDLDGADISFVDREQTIQRMRSRPDLYARQNEEIE